MFIKIRRAAEVVKAKIEIQGIITVKRMYLSSVDVKSFMAYVLRGVECTVKY
jgi:hypothetical protein